MVSKEGALPQTCRNSLWDGKVERVIVGESDRTCHPQTRIYSRDHAPLSRVDQRLQRLPSGRAGDVKNVEAEI